MNHAWEEVFDGIGDLGCAILGTMVELGISVDTVLNPTMTEGMMTLDLRVLPREFRQ